MINNNSFMVFVVMKNENKKSRSIVDIGVNLTISNNSITSIFKKTLVSMGVDPIQLKELKIKETKELFKKMLLPDQKVESVIYVQSRFLEALEILIAEYEKESLLYNKKNLLSAIKKLSDFVITI